MRSRPEAIVFDGAAIGGLPAYAVAARGIALVPEGRGLFPSLSVEENLLIGGQLKRAGPWNLKRIYELFPILAERRAMPSTSLSGGQQQMVAIGRALMSNPRILLMDEPSEGLAPQIVGEVMATIRRLKGDGLSILLVEQNPKLVFAVADDIVILNGGRVVASGPTAALARQTQELQQHLGVF
jgi:branched-chain amino acid transport system ATP-binding protein